MKVDVNKFYSIKEISNEFVVSLNNNPISSVSFSDEANSSLLLILGISLLVGFVIAVIGMGMFEFNKSEVLTIILASLFAFSVTFSILYFNPEYLNSENSPKKNTSDKTTDTVLICEEEVSNEKFALLINELNKNEKYDFVHFLEEDNDPILIKLDNVFYTTSKRIKEVELNNLILERVE